MFACLASLWAGSVASAGAAMYWGNGSTIGVAEVDGTQISRDLPTGGDSVLQTHGRVCGIAVSPTHIYWNAAGTIARLDLDNGGAPQPLTGGLGCGGLALDDQYVYWSNRGGGIARAHLDGSATNLNFIDGGASNSGFYAGFDRACGVAVGGGYVYWTNRFGWSVGRARLDGSEVEPRLIEDTGSTGCGLAVSGPYLYWAGPEAIGRANLDGTGAIPRFIPGYRQVTGLAVWGPYLYWSEEGHPNTIGRVNLDGSAPNREFVIGAGGAGLAFDGRPAPPGTSPPVMLGRIAHGKGKGFAYIRVLVPGRGDLVVKAKGVGSRFLNGDPVPWRADPYELTLKLWPGKRGPEAKRIRKQLGRNGRAAVHLRFTFRAPGAEPANVFKRLYLMRKGRR